MACPVSSKPSTSHSSSSPGASQQRELFYRLMNPDDNPDVASQARDLLATALTDQARRLRRDTAGADFEYSPEALEAFLWADYDRAMTEYAAYSRAVEQGRVEIIPRDDMVFYLVQVAPAKLVDGSWLQNVPKCQHLSTDPRLNRILSNLFVIYSEELGEGKLEQNHVFIYRKLMEDMGVKLPPTHSREFAFSSIFEDGALRCAVFQMSLSLFPMDMLPEILGYNLAFEQLPLHLLITVHQMRELSLDPYYYQLHISIDNSDTGHARIAIDSVNLYMEYIRDTEGPEAVARHWDRVMNGFFLANLPFELDGRLQRIKRKLDHPNQHLIKGNQSSVEEDSNTKANDIYRRVKEVIVKKAKFGARMHGESLYIGETKIDEWLNQIVAEAERDNDSPEETSPSSPAPWIDRFLEAFFSSHYINAEKPLESTLVTQVCGFGGPMFHIFTNDELRIITDWIAVTRDERAGRSQEQAEKTQATEAQTLSVDDSSEQQSVAKMMLDLVEKKRKRGMYAHRNRTVTGDDGQAVKINDVLKSESAASIMAMMRRHYGLDDAARRSETNPFLRAFLHGGSMEKFFVADEVEVVRRWVELGGPIPNVVEADNAIDQASSDGEDCARQDQQTSPNPEARAASKAALYRSVAQGCPVHAMDDNQDTSEVTATELVNSRHDSQLVKRFVRHELSETKRSAAQSGSHTAAVVALGDCRELMAQVEALANAKIGEFSSRQRGEGSARRAVRAFLPYWLSEVAPLQGLFATPAFHASELGCVLLSVLMRMWGYPDLIAHSNTQLYLDAAQHLGVSLPDLNGWDAEQPMLFVRAISECSMAFMPEAVGVALFLVVWNHHTWRCARHLDSRLIGHEQGREHAIERRLQEQLASFQEFMKLMADGDQLARVGLGFNTIMRLAATDTRAAAASTTATSGQQVESVTVPEPVTCVDDAAALEKAAMKWQAELDRMWTAAVAQSDLNAAISGGTTLSSAM